MGFDEKMYEVNGNTVNVKLTHEDIERLMGRLAAHNDTGNNVRIRKVIFSGPATIVFWYDGSKTVVKCTKGDQLNYEMGIAMCTLKKLFGDSYLDFKKDLKKWAPEKKKEPEVKPWHIIVNTEDSEKIAKKPQDFAEAFAEFLRNWDEEHEENGNDTTSD